LFTGNEGRTVARNIFLDGKTFKDSRSVKKEPFVGDMLWGFALTWRAYRLSFTQVVRANLRAKAGATSSGHLVCRWGYRE
jgi:hypothetical protein